MDCSSDKSLCCAVSLQDVTYHNFTFSWSFIWAGTLSNPGPELILMCLAVGAGIPTPKCPLSLVLSTKSFSASFENHVEAWIKATSVRHLEL
jgi:hypothetical protein